MSSFFTRPVSDRKRKRDAPSASRSTTRPAKRQNTSIREGGRPGRNAPSRSRKERQNALSDDEISGSDSDSGASAPAADLSAASESDSEAENETAAERRLRLAERYLENIREEVDTFGFDAAEIDRDLIAERLKEDVAETKGKLYRFIAQDLDFGVAAANKTFFTADQDCITGVAAAGLYTYTVSKGGIVVKWDLPPLAGTDQSASTATNITTRRKPKFLRSFRSNSKRTDDTKYLGHTASILCVAASEDGRFLATGGADKRIVVWDVAEPESLKPIKVFFHHRDTVLSLSFRKGTNTLFSASADRTLKIWSLDDLVYIETLFGHQDHVVDVAGMAQEMCVSVGSRDRTARVWKVTEESQLVFRGGGGGGGGSKRKDSKDLDGDAQMDKLSFEEGSIDRITIIDNETFVTGSDNGTLALWSINRKKPVHSIPLAHGYESKPPLEDSFAESDMQGRKNVGRERARWITALTSLPFSDVIVSGSWDGSIRIWKITADRRRLEPVAAMGASQAKAPNDGLDRLLADVSMSKAGAATQQAESLIRGIVTDLAITERGDKGHEELCIVAAVSKQHRLGRWPGPHCKNGAYLLRVRKRELAMTNGHADDDEERESPATLR